VLFAGQAHGQFCEVVPDTGQWSLPHGPFEAMQPNAEIAHAAVLPPPPGQPELVRVVFLCRSNCPWIELSQLRSFLWKPNRVPSAVSQQDMPSAGLPVGAAEPFCGGHAFTADGDLVVLGGLDYATLCSGGFPCVQAGESNIGHEVGYRLDTSVDPPAWLDDATWPAVSALVRKHFYPAVLALPDEQMLVTGHIGAPHPDPDGPGPGEECAAPYPTWPYPGQPANDEVFEIFDPATGLSSMATNLDLATGAACGTAPATISTGNFGRLHLLGTGTVVHTNARIAGAPAGQGTRSRFLRMDVPPCGPTDLRWQVQTSPLVPTIVREGGSSVHLLVRDQSSPNGVRDVVYAIGGIDGRDETPCEDASGITNSVQRLTDPTPDGDWTDAEWQTMAPMGHRRVNHNAVLLPTGEILVTSGTDELCQPVLQAEGFRPPEVFGGSPLGEWRVRASHIRPREYHAVTGLLPDGRVFIAGGVADSFVGHSSAVYHTAEIFSPAYYFSGNRPTITAWPVPNPPTGATIEYGGTFSIDVTLGCSEYNSVQRIVLIRNSSSTHAFDTGQRYIELDPGEVVLGTYPNYVYQEVRAPHDDFVAPQGYYLLFVIDANGLPSEGRWVLVGD
jgi:hypothetical protein